MANNHMGSVEHGKLIINKFGGLARKYNLNAGIKFQFRQLDSFIHKDYIDSDLKFVKRFKETRLEKDQFQELIEEVNKQPNLVTVATPFDNESLSWLEDLDITVVKVASCSVDDWPLLEEVCKINRRIVISTGGSSLSTLHRVYKMFKDEDRDFAFMHCVGEYPTPHEHADLNRINILQEEFPDIEIGFSTHESPKETSLGVIAAAMGCIIIEKHVGVPTDTIKLNDYSCSPEDLEKVVFGIEKFQQCLIGESPTQHETLQGLKRGIYLKKTIEEGEVLTGKDLYYAMPLQEEQADASMSEFLLGQECTTKCYADAPAMLGHFRLSKHEGIIDTIKRVALNILKNAQIKIGSHDTVEISCHYGLEMFFSIGVLIIEKVNREYCKKLLIIFPNQHHPTHRHIRKEETFELLYGDCTLTLNNKPAKMKKGEPMLIERGVDHSFSSKLGAVVEEVSTKHHVGDSIYNDANINKLDISERKINITL